MRNMKNEMTKHNKGILVIKIIGLTNGNKHIKIIPGTIITMDMRAKNITNVINAPVAGTILDVCIRSCIIKTIGPDIRQLIGIHKGIGHNIIQIMARKLQIIETAQPIRPRAAAIGIRAIISIACTTAVKPQVMKCKAKPIKV